MEYKMIVDIYDPNSIERMFSCVRLYLNCSVFYDPDDYGNGCYLFISGNDFNEKIYDVRFDKSFSIEKSCDWFNGWATNYWSGKFGAWSIRNLQIVKLD